MIPPISDLLFAVHASVFEPPSKRRKILGSITRDLGLCQRVWKLNEKLKRELKISAEKVFNMDAKEFVRVLLWTLYRYLQTSDIGFIEKALFLVESYYCHPKDYIWCGLPSRGVEAIPDRVERITDQELGDILGRIREIVEASTLGALLLSKADMFLGLIIGKGFEELDVESIYSLLRMRHQGILRMWELLIMAVLLSRINVRDGFKAMLVGNILDLMMDPEFWDIPVRIFMDAIIFVAETDRQLILNILCAQRIAEIHGGEAFYGLYSSIVPPRKIFTSVKLLIILNSYNGFRAMKIIARSIRNNKFGLRTINDIMFGLKKKPRGIALAIPWELYGDITTLRNHSDNALRYFREASVVPPKRLVQLRRLMSYLIKSAELLGKKIEGIKEIIDALAIILRTRTLANMFLANIKRGFGYVPGFFRVVSKIDQLYSKLSKKWEYSLITKYYDLIETKRELFVPSIIPSSLNEDPHVANLVIIVDGLRYDDCALRLVPKLISSGFKCLELSPKIALLPSITHISRKGIVCSDIDKSFLLSRELRKRESEILIEKYRGVEVYYGPIGLVLNKFRRKHEHSRLVFFILSELEKSMHGASESILVHFVEEYLNSIVELIMFVVSELARSYKSVRLILCSDHGLGAYVRYEGIDDFLEELKRKRLLDRGLSPIVKERYALLALNDSSAVNDAKQIYLQTEDFREKFWLTSADMLRFKEVEFRRVGSELLTRIKPANSVLVLFPKGRIKFQPGRGAVYHGGLSPEETFSAYAVFDYVPS